MNIEWAIIIAAAIVSVGIFAGLCVGVTMGVKILANIMEPNVGEDDYSFKLVLEKVSKPALKDPSLPSQSTV